ncbi:MAG: hypothetical protein ISS26_04635 [Candidatus Omnitrophica bacterium]|nr:hypothetical protein [Candidatus Omnitrophota bacterium]
MTRIERILHLFCSLLSYGKLRDTSDALFSCATRLTLCSLSDKAVQETLAGEGIVIQRRTVAKYRESLRILPTHLRKKK